MSNRTPLHWAAAMGHSQCVSVLLNMGVTPNPQDIEGGTPLDYARQTGHKGKDPYTFSPSFFPPPSTPKHQGIHIHMKGAICLDRHFFLLNGMGHLQDINVNESVYSL